MFVKLANTNNIINYPMKQKNISSLFFIICCLFFWSCTDDLEDSKHKNEINTAQNISGLIQYAQTEYNQQRLRSTSFEQKSTKPDWDNYKIHKQSGDTLSISIPIFEGSDGERTMLVANQINSGNELFLVKLPGATHDTLPMNIRRRVIINKDGEARICRPVVDKNGHLRLAKIRNSTMLKSGGFSGGTLPEVTVYPGSFDYGIDWWWWDYIGGLAFGSPPPGYGGYVPPSPSTPTRPEYAKAANVSKNADVKNAIETMTKNMKADASKDKGRRERGFWVYYDKSTGKYYTGKEKTGEYVKGGEGTHASVKPGGSSPNSNGDHIPKTATPVTFVHTHTPLTYESDAQRPVGFSTGDISYANEYQIEIIVIDYVGTEADDGNYYLYGGHNIDDPTKEYIYIPNK